MISHEDWARLCFAHVLAETRGKSPLVCSLDEWLPFDRIPIELTDAAVKQTLESHRTVEFVAYGIRRRTALTIPLRASADGKYDYRRIADTEYWRDTPAYQGIWSFLAPFVAALPFESVGRMMIMFSTSRGRGVLHFDHDKPTLVHEFIWLKPTNKKRFLIRYGSRDHYVSSRSCWFDSRHMHRTDEGSDLEVSMRIDGIFTAEFRQWLVRRYADILEIEDPPYVMPPDPSYFHEYPSDWNRLLTPRHYAHYFRTWAKEIVRNGRFVRILTPESSRPKPEAH